MAAGGSKRLHSPKQLLLWQGDYLINHMIGVAAASRLDKLVVVLGSSADDIRAIIKNEDIKIVINPDWEQGLGSSIRTGIANLKEDTDAVMILLVDQPFLSKELLDQMIDRFCQTQAQVVAPRVGDQQVNPVLFRKDLFPELMAITGDRGGKEVLKRHTVEWVDWQDERLLLDIDSAEDYQKLIG
jgi:molybdenum cofactor cytidylyltransferase